MKIALFDPYIDTYMLTIAELLLEWGHQVTLFWPKDDFSPNEITNRFDLNLKNIQIEKRDIFSLTQKNTSLFTKYRMLRKFDLCIALSDGSIPFLFAKKNYLHVQVPFKDISLSPIDKLKFFFITKIICNSHFTENIIQQTYQTNKTTTLHPPVNTLKYNPNAEKKQTILSVSRFDNILHSKRQDILITAFKKLHDLHPEYKLILAGGSKQTESKNKYIKELKETANGYPVEFCINPSSDKLASLYNLSEFFWHAAGYGVDEFSDPERTEHFGIVFVEAQSAGTIPFGVDKGGIREIITPGINGFVYSSLDELVLQTSHLISHPELKQNILSSMIKNSENFTLNVFSKNLKSILSI